MQNFQKIGSGLDVVPALNAIMRRPELWNADKLRQTFPNSPHREVDDIWVRFNDTKDEAKIPDDCEAINYDAFFLLPQVRGLVFGLMGYVEGERLGRVIITRLKPGGRIYPHADEGAPATYYDRYIICLSCLPGTIFRIGDEQVQMATGETWWINNREEHEVLNNSVDDRVIVICDIRCSR